MSSFRHTVYVVIPLGGGPLGATEADIQAVRDAVRPFTSHALTAKRVCDDITRDLERRLR